MISISCTNCKAMLTIDEAFAGGVCRCQHCGTIQTVPTAAKGNDGLAGGTVSGQSLGGSKVMVPKQSTGTGLDDLADIVASSGLAGSGLTSRRLSRTPTTPGAATEPPKAKFMPMVAGGAAMGVVVVAAIAFFATRGDENAGADANIVTAVDGDSGASAAVTVRGPSFAGVALDGNTVIYVLDRGSGTRDVFELLKIATLRSIGSLGNDRKFQVMFWDNGTGEDLVFPETGPTYATAKKLEELRSVLDGAAAFGATDPTPVLAKAYAQSPDAVVLATGKGGDLSEEFIAGVETARKGVNIRTYTFSLGEGGSTALKSIAEKTNAQYKHLTPKQLDVYTR